MSGISKVKDGDRLLTVCSEAQDDAEGAGGPWEERLCLDAHQKTKMDEMIDLQNTASATTDVEKRAQLQKEYDLACAQLQELFVGSEDISSGAISDYVMDAIARAEGNGREVSRTSYVIVLAYCGSRLTAETMQSHTGLDALHGCVQPSSVHGGALPCFATGPPTLMLRLLELPTQAPHDCKL